MERITLNARNRIQLADPNLNNKDNLVSYSITNQIGTYVKNSNGNEIKDIKAEYDSTGDPKRFYAIFEFDPETKGDYFNLNFKITDTKGNLVQSDFYLVGLKLDREGGVKIVPAEYFKEFVANGELDDADFKERIMKYPSHQIEQMLSAATGRLQDQLKLYLTPQTVEHEGHDWYGEPLRQNWWLIQTHESPIIEITSYELWFAEKKIFEIDPKYLIVRKLEGEIQFIPAIGQQMAFIYMNNVESTMLTLITSHTGAGYVPNVFRISYKYGLDYMELPKEERDAIYQAIVAKTLIDNLPNLKSELQKGSENQSVDGQTYGFSNRGLDWLNNQQKLLDAWVFDFKRKYNKLVETYFI